MISKQELLDSILDDIRIIQHLSTKILPGTLNYKPTEKQRTLLELLQYLSYAGSATTEFIQTSDGSKYGPLSENAKNLQSENFISALDEEAKKIQEVFSQMSDEELRGEIELWVPGFKQSRAAWLLNMVSKMYAAYRMQLFLYIKATGNEGIGTSNLWSGVDAK